MPMCAHTTIEEVLSLRSSQGKWEELKQREGLSGVTTVFVDEVLKNLKI